MYGNDQVPFRIKRNGDVGPTLFLILEGHFATADGSCQEWSSPWRSKGKSSVSKWLPSGPLPHLLLNIQSNLRIHNPESHRLFHQKQSQFYMMLLMKMKPSLQPSILNCTIKAIYQTPSKCPSFLLTLPFGCPAWQSINPFAPSLDQPCFEAGLPEGNMPLCTAINLSLSSYHQSICLLPEGKGLETVRAIHFAPPCGG